MGYIKRAKHIVLLAAVLFLQSCSGDVDLGGFFYTEERANERFNDSMEWNLLHPETNIFVLSDSYSFLAAGDSHCGPTANLDFLIGKAHEPGVAFSLIAGDVTTGLKDDYVNVMDHLEGFAPEPYFVALGNHDLFFHGWISFTEHFGTSVYTFTVTTLSGQDLFICLDTATGTLGSKQMEWLKETLESRRNSYRNCVVFTHVNFFREHRVQSTTILVEEVYALLDLFADYNIDMVIMGHDHGHAVENFGETVYITLDALEDDFGDASYLRITNRRGSVTYDFVSVD